MNIRKRALEGLILAFALSVYQLIFQPLYNVWLKTVGHTPGVFETALGYFLVIFITWFVSGFFTRHMDNDEK